MHAHFAFGWTRWVVILLDDEIGELCHQRIKEGTANDEIMGLSMRVWSNERHILYENPPFLEEPVQIDRSFEMVCGQGHHIPLARGSDGARLLDGRRRRIRHLACRISR